MASLRTTCSVCLVVLVLLYQVLWVTYYFSHHNDFVKVKLVSMADTWKSYNFRFTSESGSLELEGGIDADAIDMEGTPIEARGYQEPAEDADDDAADDAESSSAAESEGETPTSGGQAAATADA